MRHFILDCSRKELKNAKSECYKRSVILNYRYDEETRQVEILGALGNWRPSILRIDALLNMAGLKELKDNGVAELVRPELLDQILYPKEEVQI